MDWFTTAIADATAFRVLLDRLRMEVADAQAAAQLGPSAQIYVITEAQTVRLRFNDAALEGVRTLGTLAFYQCAAPLACDRINPLVT